MANSTTTTAGRNFGAGAQFGRLLALQLRRLSWTRKTKAMLAIQLIPVIASFVAVIIYDVDGLTMFGGLTEFVTLPFLVPMTAIFYGGPTIVDEMEGRTLTYLTLRPIPRSLLYLGKLVAGTIVALGLTLLPILIIFAICLSGSSDYGASLEQLGFVLLGAGTGTIVYCTIFGMLGALLATSLLASIVYYGVIEFFFGFFPIIEMVTMRYHIKGVAGFNSSDRGPLDSLFVDEAIVLDWWMSLIVLGVVVGATLAIGAWVFKDRKYVV